MTAWKNQLKTILLLGALSAMLVGLGALVAPGHLYLLGALAVALNLGAWLFSDRIVLRMHRASEVGPAEAPELHAIVAELSARAGIPRPRVFVIPDEQPNAFATGRSPRQGVVAVTEGLLRLLDRRELRGVIAHELAHIKHRDVLLSSVAATLVSVLTWAGHAIGFGVLGGGGGDERDEGHGAGAGLLAALLVPIAGTLVQLGISRSREYLADAAGAEISGDPEALASALLRLEAAASVVPSGGPAPATASLFIVNPFGALETAAAWFSTHPSTAERVRRLRELSRRGLRAGGLTRAPAPARSW